MEQHEGNNRSSSSGQRKECGVFGLRDYFILWVDIGYLMILLLVEDGGDSVCICV